MNPLLEKYALLLVDYCLSIERGDRLFVESTTLAEPLVREVYRLASRRGAIVEVDLDFREKKRIFQQEALTKQQLQHAPMLYREAMEHFEAYLYIRAPFTLRQAENDRDEKLTNIRRAALQPYRDHYFRRIGDGSMRRSLCQYPTLANAQEAGMSLEEYEYFVYDACRLFVDDPIASWKEVRSQQQLIVDWLEQRETIRYQSAHTDISFSTKGRRWINSDGRTNMPSGEVYTSPVEDSVNGHIHFTLPAVYRGKEVEDVTLWVKDGYIEKWEAKRGKDFLDSIFALPGTRRFGEAAIGTNYRIQRQTKNILFDEKMGGTVHMAIGQSYAQAGGQNQSNVHWDMITDMTQGGIITADGEKCYENGQFLID